MIVVAGTIEFTDQATRDAAVAASVALQRSARDEPGCLAYCFAADPAEPLHVQVYELWVDEASLAAHFEHPNYHEMKALMRRFPRGAPSSTAKYRCDAIAPVYDETGRPTAGFASA